MDEFVFAKPSAPVPRRYSGHSVSPTGPRFRPRSQSTAQKLSGLAAEVVASRRQLLDRLRTVSSALEMRQRETVELSLRREALVKNLAFLLQTAKSGKSFISTGQNGEVAVAEIIKRLKDSEASLAVRKQEVENIRRRINGDRMKRMKNREEAKLKMKAEREKCYADMKKSQDQKIKMTLDEYKRKFFDIRNQRKTEVRSLGADYQKRCNFLENEIFKFKRLARQRSAPSFPATPASNQSSFVLASSLLNRPRASTSSVTANPASSLSCFKASGALSAPRPFYSTAQPSQPASYNTASPHARFTRDFRSQLREVSQKATTPSADTSKGLGWGVEMPTFASSSSAEGIKISSERKSRGILKKSSAHGEYGSAFASFFPQASSSAAPLRQDALRLRPEQASSLQSLKTALCTSTSATAQGSLVSRWPVPPVHSPFPQPPVRKARKVRFEDEALQGDSDATERSEGKKDLKRKLYIHGSDFYDQN